MTITPPIDSFSPSWGQECSGTYNNDTDYIPEYSHPVKLMLESKMVTYEIDTFYQLW